MMEKKGKMYLPARKGDGQGTALISVDFHHGGFCFMAVRIRKTVEFGGF